MLAKLWSKGLQIGVSQLRLLGRVNTILFPYSQTPNHPTIQKILEGKDLTNTQQVLHEIKGLNDKNREIALKLLLRNLYTQKLPASVAEDDNFISQAEKHPELLIDSQLYLIKMKLQKFNDLLLSDSNKVDKDQSISAMESTISNINSLFNRCFQQYKKLPKQKKDRPGITINKRFADYYLFYMAPIFLGDEKERFLTTARQVYRGTIQAMSKLINEDGMRVKLMDEKNIDENQTQDDKKIAVHTMKQNLRVLVETDSECVINMFRAINELHRLKNDPVAFSDGTIQSLSNMERAIMNYKILDNMKNHSIYYHHLKRVKCEVQYFYKMSIRQGNTPEKKVQLEKAFEADMNQVYKQSKEDLEKISNQKKLIATIGEISIVMFQIRLQILTKINKDASELKYKLVQEIQTILEIFTNQQIRKIVESKLASALQSVFKVASKKQSQQTKADPKK